MEFVDFSDETQKARFDEAIASDPHAFLQQSTAWAESVAPIAGDEPFFFFVRTKDYFISASLYYFRSDLGNILVSNVQPGSLGCFSFSGPEDHREAAYKNIIGKIINEARSRDCMSVTLTSNPYAGDRDVLKSSFQPETGMNSFVSVIPINKFFSADGSVQFRDYNRRTNLSRNIKKSRQHGFQLKVSHAWDDIEEWHSSIHTKRIRELEGSPLPLELFRNLAFNRRLAENVVFFKLMHEDRMISGDFCVFGENGNFDNFMMSTDSEYLDRGVNFFLVDEILKWCFQNRINVYNWQSTNPPRGGIFRFKEQWGSEIRLYDYFTRVLDQSRFERLFKMDIQHVMSVFSGHFVAPYKTLVEARYGFFDKFENNRSASIFTNDASKPGS